MENGYSIPLPRPGDALVRFLRELSELASRAAREIELGATAVPRPSSSNLDDLPLGTLQSAVVRAPGMATDEGVKPRAIADYLERGDEPNVRTTLQALAKRGVAELVPGSAPQRWRLTAPFRAGG